MTKVRPILWAGVLVCLAFVLTSGGCRSAHTTSAILYIEEQQYDKAVNVLHEGLEYNPDEPDAYFMLGEAHSKLAEVAVQDNAYEEARKNYELAYDYYERAKNLDPVLFTEKSDMAMQHNYTMRSNDAKLEYQAGYYEQAEGFFRLAYAALPDSITSIKNLARMKMKMAAESANDPALLGEALELIDQVLAAHPSAYELQADKASILAKLGRTTEAGEIYAELLKDHGDDPSLLIDIANLAIDENQYERAADLFIRIIGIFENDEDPANDMEIKGMLVKAGAWLAYDEIARYDEALGLFDRALQLETVPTQNTLFEYLRTYYNYGEALTKQAESETDPVRKTEIEAKAKAQYSRGVEVGNALVSQYPNYKFGYYYLGLCQYSMGDETGGELNLKRYNELESAGE
jgi:tetratricopeptide (TPR) repeat protein